MSRQPKQSRKTAAATAAEQGGREPWDVNFKAALQSINEFTKRLAQCSSREAWLEGFI